MKVTAATLPATVCPYCLQAAKFCPSSAHVYSGRDYGPIWDCRACDAYVGCHRNSERPKGTLADARTRAARQNAHRAFDPLWQAKMRKEGCKQDVARGAAYRWLAERLGMTREACHIAMMTAEQADQVRLTIEAWRSEQAQGRAA